MSFWNNVGYRKQMFLQNFGKGLNTYDDPAKIDPEELTDCVNVSCDDYPVIRTRNDRVLEDADTLTGRPNGVGSRGTSQIHVLDDGIWKYRALASTAWTDINSVAISTDSTQASFVGFNTYALTTDGTTGARVRYTVLACANSSNRQNAYWSEDSTYGFFTTSYAEPSSGTTYTNYPPQSNLLVSHRYRIYGFDHDRRTLRFSELGNPLWYKAENYLDVTEMKGSARAITAYADHIIVWGEHSMHELYGESNFNFELVNVSNTIGCVGKYAHTECDSRLFWLDYNGVFMYTGGLARPVGIKAKKYLDGINWNVKDLIAMGSFKSKLYLTIPYNTTYNSRTIVIDVKDIYNGNELVTIEDNANIQSYVSIADKLYALFNDGRIWNIDSTLQTGFDNSTAISWSFESKPLTDDGLDLNSAVRDVWVEHQGSSTNASMALKYSTNSHSTTYSTFAASSDFSHMSYMTRDRIICSSTELQGVNHIKWQFSGTGYKKVYGLHANTISYGNVQ